MKIYFIKKLRVDGFKLICEFREGEVVEYDMSDIKTDSGSMIEPLRDPAFFSKVFIEAGAPTWPNGYDVSPETIYHDGKHLNSDHAS